MMKPVVRYSLLTMVVTFTLGPLAGSAQQATVAPAQIATDVRKHLLSLPYYGVFDLLTFNVDNNDAVILAGYVLTDSLKKDAEREVREVKDIKEVQNKIAIAPGLPLDDQIRHGVYHAIYGDSSLSRYGTPGSELRSMRPGFRDWGAGFGGWGPGFGGRGAGIGGPGAGFGGRGAGIGGPGTGFGGRAFGGPHLMGAPFYGYDPVGNYAIHILVNNRTVTLAGVVDNEGDKTLAGLKARGVMNVNQVNNELEVATKS
jgi:osmotically-inducible protein OsmY